MSVFRLQESDSWKSPLWSGLSHSNGPRAKGHYSAYQRAILGIHPSHQIDSEGGRNRSRESSGIQFSVSSLLRKKGPFLTPFSDPPNFYRR